MENIFDMFHMFCFLCFSVNKDRVLCERQTHRVTKQTHRDKIHRITHTVTHGNRQMQKTAFFKQEHIQTHTTDRQSRA